MTARYAEEIAANIERAEQSLGAARSLVAQGYYDIAASRAYYAAFLILLTHYVSHITLDVSPKAR